ncbi:MAG: biotin--[acetyl-CoA-carboxylase] ligase [Planctomycetaceae bacterium]|nr:Bifunctional ligase/repressor BirA [Planctomycetota bacterium]MCQ3949679.1 biotin--[acetyl-CoA-carboxylase] ligase [Planctomycetota bacterium]NUO16636.1 biotin--[acetyl-CoA-carboxylase] ligase [Planctomycetaceae bacterium]HRJ79231.1 biotin--[acetyl-CoA-carboxylase] ligase [Planctomycetota bacterium]
MNFELLSYLKKQSDFTAVADVEAALTRGKSKKPKSTGKQGPANDALFRDIEELIEQGYNIEFHPYLGVKLIDIPDRLFEHEIREDLNTERVGKVLHIHDQVDSTNEAAWKLLESNPAAEDGTVILAERQVNGRGRLGRSWHSPAGCGIWMSVILRVQLPPDKLALLTATASVALANMLQQFIHLPSEIKWPNDVMVRGRKVAGVLVEARSTLPDTYVMGIGLNVNQQTADFPEELRGIATSLRIERPGSAPVNRVRVVRPLLFYLDSVYRLIHKKKYDKIARAWAEFVPMGGRKVRLSQGDKEFTGTVVELDPARGITLKLEGGKETKLFAAETVNNVREA